MDYASISAQNVTFAPNQSEQFVQLRTVADSTVEGRESLSAVLSDGSEGVTIGQETANITITEDACRLCFLFCHVNLVHECKRSLCSGGSGV